MNVKDILSKIKRKNEIIYIFNIARLESQKIHEGIPYAQFKIAKISLQAAFTS